MFKKNNIKFLFLVFIVLIFSLYYFTKKSANKYLWSKRYIDYNYYNEKETEYISNKKIILNQINNSSNYIWIRNTSNNSNVKTDLDYLGDLIDQIKKPIILITTDGDRSVPSSYDKNLVNKILSSNKIINWYTQNYDKSIIHPKLNYYPIGLDMHTKKWLNISYFDKFRSNETLRNNKFNYYISIRNNKINKKIEFFVTLTYHYLIQEEKKCMKS